MASEQEEWAESMAGIEARQQGSLNPEVEVGERADAAPRASQHDTPEMR